jgi:predicted dehydrogenase
VNPKSSVRLIPALAQRETDGPVRIGLTGLGGYAGYMCERILADAASASPCVQLAAVCEPHIERFAEMAGRLRERGVVIVSDYNRLLELDIEAVCLPLPIDLHRPYTLAALKAGKAVLCEKPAAGCVDDVDAMIAARDASGLPVAIGFQDLYHPALHELKRRLLSGEFGAILGASVMACWPRGDRYFGRNNWAGVLRRDGRWVMDSPASNALAHYIHLVLFLLGPAPRESAVPETVEAELYRANAIQNYDTCSLRLSFDGGARHLLIGLTHACAQNIEPQPIIRTERARICYAVPAHIQITTSSITETLPLLRNPHASMFNSLHRWVRVGPEAAIGATLEMARAHVLAMNVASEATVIHDVPAACIQTIEDEAEQPLRTIRGIEAALQQSIAAGKMLHESGLLSWSQPAGTKRTEGYTHFSGPAGLKLKIAKRVKSHPHQSKSPAV